MMVDAVVPVASDLPAEGDDPAEKLPAGMTKTRLLFLEALVFHALPREEAAEAAGITARAGRKIMRDPRCLKIYQQMMTALRASERPKSIARLASLRDAGKSERVQFEAARELAREPSNAPLVAIGIQNTTVMPGYSIHINPEHMRKARGILAAAGGDRTVLDLEGV
jgi:hypothetical protein